MKTLLSVALDTAAYGFLMIPPLVGGRKGGPLWFLPLFLRAKLRSRKSHRTQIRMPHSLTQSQELENCRSSGAAREPCPQDIDIYHHVRGPSIETSALRRQSDQTVRSASRNPRRTRVSAALTPTLLIGAICATSWRLTKPVGV